MNNTQINEDSAVNGYIIFGITQLVAGGILLWASIYGFSVLQNYVVVLPAIMAVAVIGFGIKAIRMSKGADTEISTAL